MTRPAGSTTGPDEPRSRSYRFKKLALPAKYAWGTGRLLPEHPPEAENFRIPEPKLAFGIAPVPGFNVDIASGIRRDTGTGLPDTTQPSVGRRVEGGAQIEVHVVGENP